MTEKEMEKLIQKMQGVFATAKDHTNLETKVDTLIDDHVKLETKVDKIAETTNETLKEVRSLSVRFIQTPTKDELFTAIQETYNLAKLQAEHDRMKKIMQEKLNVEV